jgi:hypothetical protein
MIFDDKIGIIKLATAPTIFLEPSMFESSTTGSSPTLGQARNSHHQGGITIPKGRHAQQVTKNGNFDGHLKAGDGMVIWMSKSETIQVRECNFW